jgi:hypothetical protein
MPSAPLADYVPMSIAHFVSFEVSLIDTPRRVGSFAAARHWTSVAVVWMEAIVYIAVEISGSMKPWANANEYTSSEPFRAVVARWGAVIRRHVVVAVGTNRCYADVDADAYLRIRSWRGRRETACGNDQCQRKCGSMHKFTSGIARR